jgi:Tol biopolymer transport system component
VQNKEGKMEIRKRLEILLGALLALVIILGPLFSQSQDPAEKIYQAALLKKTGDGNLEEAIRLFQQIVKEYPQKRELASKALLQIGLCYEQLGEEKAEAAYRQLISDYPEQQQVVKIAKEKLAARTQAQSIEPKSVHKLTLREISAPIGAPSPDGRYIALEGERGTNILLYDLETNTKVPLTEHKPSPLAWCDDPKWSNDGKKVAYIRHTSDEIWELHVVTVSGRKNHVLFSDPNKWIFRLAGWSPDNESIYVIIHNMDRILSLGSISVVNGTFGEILKLSDERPYSIALSPNGKYLGFDYHLQENTRQRDIRLVATDRSDVQTDITHPASERFLGWTPDSNAILFSSDRAGGNGIWTLPVNDQGKPRGEPRLIQTMTGSIWPYGVTNSGSLYFSETFFGKDVYIAQLDLDSGKILKPVEKIEKTLQGHTESPFWSADGKFLGYLFRHVQGFAAFDYNILRIYSLNDGTQKEFLLDFKASIYSQLPRWSPDGRHIYFTGSKQGKNGLFRFDLETGKSELYQEVKGLVAFSSDGSLLFRGDRIMKRNLSEMQYWVMRMDSLQKEKEVLRGEVGILLSGISLSFDRQWLGFRRTDYSKSGSVTGLSVVPASGGDSIDIFQTSEGNLNLTRLFWGPPGKGLLLAKRYVIDGQEQKSQLWYYPKYQGGITPRKMDLEMEGIQRLSFHPDGKTIAFSSGQYSKSKFWILENFLTKEEEK